MSKQTDVSGWRSFKEEKPLDAQRYHYSQGNQFFTGVWSDKLNGFLLDGCSGKYISMKCDYFRVCHYAVYSMIYTEQDIEKAVANLASRNQAPIVRHYDGYIILAQNENDFKTKVSKIQRGDTVGFYTMLKHFEEEMASIARMTIHEREQVKIRNLRDPYQEYRDE